MTYSKEKKAIALLAQRAEQLTLKQEDISHQLDKIKADLVTIPGALEATKSRDFANSVIENLDKMSVETPLEKVNIDEIYSLADSLYSEEVAITSLLDKSDLAVLQDRVSCHIREFNKRYELDAWDYAIAGGSGLFAAMLDLLCVKAPPKPTTSWSSEVDGIFNKEVQNLFNAIFPKEFSKKLEQEFFVGAPDTSVSDKLLGNAGRILSPYNHRLRSLAHDPILGFLIGVKDIRNGTCTIVTDGIIKSIPSQVDSPNGSLFYLIGRMIGHLASDVNTPSANGNRGMGLPAPFMGLLRMLEGIPVGDSNFGRQIEYMYLRGYDFRQFAASSIPMLIMEVLMRVFYVGKQMKLYGVSFENALMDTIPTKMNPRFRVMLAIAYGTSCSINAGKMYVTQSILNANYASWLGLAWNGFHAIKWALFQKELSLWSELEEKEIKEMENLIIKIEEMEKKATRLPVS